MTLKRTLALCAALVVLCLTLGMLPDEAYAQSDSGSAQAIDRDLVTKQSVRDSMAGIEEEEDDDGGPSRTQMALGVGSVIVMIIVVKWL